MRLFKFSIFVLFVFGLLLSSNLVFAVDKAAVSANSSEVSTLVPLARVNILDAKIVSSNESTFNISFKISNGEGLQGGVRYGVKLFSLNDKGQPGVIVDEKVFPESLSLAANSILDKEIVYDAPKILSGSFMLAVSSENESGFPFGLNPVGKINLVSSLKGVKILNETCSTKLETKETNKDLQKLILNQGDRVRLTCTAINSENESVSVIPYFETNLNSAYGKQVEALGGDTTVITFNKLEKKTFSVILPQPKDPQVYYTKTMLKEGGQYSNAIGTTYVVNGTSASIENLFFDKDYFKNGDTANLSILWTSRSEMSDDLSLSISITNKDDNKCGEAVNQILSQSTVNTKTNIPVTITKNCINPKALVAISDKAGKVLDQKTFSIDTKSVPNKISSGLMSVIYLIIFIIIVGFIFYNFKKKNKSGGNPINIPPQMTVLLFLIACSFIPFSSVKADTFSFPESAARVTISSESASYNPGNYIPAGVVKINAYFSLNGVAPANLVLQISRKNFTIVDGGYDYVTFPASNTPGTFNTAATIKGKSSTSTFSSCSGTYNYTDGYCSISSYYTGQGDRVTGGAREYEGMLCSNLSEVECSLGSDVHPCKDWVSTTATESCVGLSQASCGASSGCTENYSYNWGTAYYAISYVIAIPTPIVTVTASSNPVNMGQDVFVTWDAKDFPVGTKCVGDASGSGLPPHYDFIRDGRIFSGPTGIKFNPTLNTEYKVNCTTGGTTTPPPPVASCSGTYTVSTGTCGPYSGAFFPSNKAEHICGYEDNDQTPQQNLCRSLSASNCEASSHGCCSVDTTSSSYSCVGLSQASCTSHSTCTWK